MNLNVVRRTYPVCPSTGARRVRASRADAATANAWSRVIDTPCDASCLKAAISLTFTRFGFGQVSGYSAMLAFRDTSELS
ncbi:hypothetical protein [Fodinicurvata sp. EGI_FJ10296]|uniref:hypothetical protein n=1 Tax=Fodinicurvata sp. EGI_FJ10296 TaxID=3231908 RepID=UPI0034561E35